MSRTSFLSIVLVAAVTSTPPVALAADTPLDVSVSGAPIAPDGTTSGAVTDFVLTFADRDPSVDGLGLPTGSTITVDLPAAFVNTGAGGDNAIILQGWPQSPIIPFPYTIAVNGNQVTLALTSDFMPGSDGEGGPGPKQVHLFLGGFVNPSPGWYDIPLAIDTGAGGSYCGVGRVHIIPHARPSVNIVSFASGGGPPPPFNNPVYRDLGLGEDGLLSRLFVWEAGSVPMLDLDLSPTVIPNLYRFVQGNRTVGHAWIAAPPGASDYMLTTTGPSVIVPNPVGLVPTGGLDTVFIPDPNVSGEYVITFRLNNGNSQQQSFLVL